MNAAFTIIQIGQEELDNICSEAIVPAIESCELVPKRVDVHTEGGFLKSEIINLIENSEIIVADLTNERPNCYLDVGYATGAQRFGRLILTARADHHHDHPKYDRNGPKIHFDLLGYDILFWEPENIDGLRQELTKRIKRRLSQVSSIDQPDLTPSLNDDLFSSARTDAIKGFAARTGNLTSNHTT